MANKYLSKINKLIEIDSLNARVFFFIVYTLLACLLGGFFCEFLEIKQNKKKNKKKKIAMYTLG